MTNGKYIFTAMLGVASLNAMYNPQNEKLHRRKTKSCLSENEAYP